MANKTFHIPPTDESLWAAVKVLAERNRTSQYRLVVAALEDYLPRVAEQPPPADRWAAIANDAA